MIDAAREAISFARGRVRDDLETDRQLLLSLDKEIEVGVISVVPRILCQTTGQLQGAGQVGAGPITVPSMEVIELKIIDD